MNLDTLLSTIVLVSFIVTIVLAVGSYMAYKFRDRRRPRDPVRAVGAPVYFERYRPPSSADARAAQSSPQPDAVGPGE